jgi:hypothetical protein
MLHSITFAFLEKLLDIAATIFLVLVVVGVALIGPHNKLPGRNNAPLPMKSLGKMPTLQVELARKDSDLVQVFNSGDLKCNLKDARKGNTLDTFLFIPAYSGLLITIGLMLACVDKHWRGMLVQVALVAVPLAPFVIGWRTTAIAQRSTNSITALTWSRVTRRASPRRLWSSGPP